MGEGDFAGTLGKVWFLRNVPRSLQETEGLGVSTGHTSFWQKTSSTVCFTSVLFFFVLLQTTHLACYFHCFEGLLSCNSAWSLHVNDGLHSSIHCPCILNSHNFINIQLAKKKNCVNNLERIISPKLIYLNIFIHS